MSKVSDKELKARQKQLDKLQARLKSKESQLDKREKKVAQKERLLQQTEARLNADRKDIAREKKSLAQTKKKSSAKSGSRTPRVSSRGDGGSTRKLKEMEASLKKAKADAARATKQEKRHYQTILDQEQRIKVLERQVKNLKKKGRKKDDRKLRNSRREARQLKKRLKQLLRELAKKRQWYTRAIKKFKRERHEWARKQQQAAGEGVRIKYVFLDDVKKVAVYRRAKDASKLHKRVRFSLDAADKAQMTLKNVDVVFSEDSAKKSRPKKKGSAAFEQKSDEQCAQDEDDLDAYLDSLFPTDAAALKAEVSDGDAAFDEELDALIAVSSESESEEAPRKAKRRKRGGEETKEDGDEDDDDSDFGLGDTQDADELKAQISEMSKEALQKNGDLKRVRRLLLEAGIPAAAKALSDDSPQAEDSGIDEFWAVDLEPLHEAAGVDATDGVQPLEALKACVESKVALEQVFADSKKRHCLVHTSLDSWNFDFAANRLKEADGDFVALLQQLSADALLSRTAYMRLLASVRAYMRELCGRVCDLSALNEVFYNKVGAYQSPEQRQTGFGATLQRAAERHEDEAADMGRIALAAGDLDGGNDAKQLAAGAALRAHMRSDNDDWRSQLAATAEDWATATERRALLVAAVCHALNAMPTVQHLDLQALVGQVQGEEDEEKGKEEEEEHDADDKQQAEASDHGGDEDDEEEEDEDSS